jgi:hypothetical protein
MLAAALRLSMVAPCWRAQAAETDVHAMFDQAERDGRVGLARKTRPVDVRAAEPGEVVVTEIAGEGKETQSPPAQAGDRVVRNRCPETGNEEILVGAAKFAERYEGPLGPADGAGWQPYRPRGIEMAYFVVRAADGTFTFTAPGASRWSRARATRSCATRATRRTPIGSRQPRSRAPTRSCGTRPEPSR